MAHSLGRAYLVAALAPGFLINPGLLADEKPAEPPD